MVARKQCAYRMMVAGRLYAQCNLPAMHVDDGHRLLEVDTGHYVNAPYTCGHCGRPMGNMAGGYAIVSNGQGRSVRVCHPNAPDRPDCYRLITVYHEVIGVRLDETEVGFP